MAERPWKAAAAWMVCCSLLFLGVYNACNWITTLRSDVATWNFDWEFQIPFVPWMIVPYWSLDLFFVISFFICGTRDELAVHGRRIVLAILVAGTCFILWPLKLAFPRPEVSGFLGLWFDALRSFDQPHNLAPSLHIALRTIIWPVIVPRTKGLWNLLARGWFLLIGVSTLLTWQHQVLDVLTGWVLAIACLQLEALGDEACDRHLGVRSARIGTYYSLGAALLLAAAMAFWPWGCVLLWPSTALAVVAAGYWWLGSIVFRKLHGRLPFSTRVLLGPVLVGHHLSLLYYRRQCRAWDEVVPGLLIGRKLSNAEAREAVAQGVTAVLDLTTEFSEAEPFLQTRYCNIPLLDLTAPTPEQLRRAIEFITAERERGTVYVHCKIGYSRSAAVVGAYLLAAGEAAGAEEAIERLRSVRTSIIVRMEARRAIEEFAAER